MSDDSDTLRASSSSFTPFTTSSDASAPSNGQAGTHRVNTVRQTERGISTPVPMLPTEITIEVPRARYPPANAGTRSSPSPKRALEQYKPTVSRDDKGFIIYYDPSLSGQWRRIKRGYTARAPAEHRPGGRYFLLPPPPNYSASNQLAELKKIYPDGDDDIHN